MFFSKELICIPKKIKFTYIIDIYDYFGLKYEVTDRIRVYDERRIYGWIIVAFTSLVVAGAVAAEIVIFRKKKKARDAAYVSEAKEE